MPTVFNNRVYALGRIFDARNGTVLREKIAPAELMSGYIVAGRHLFTVTSNRKENYGVFHVSDLDGKLLQRNALAGESRSGARLDQLREWTGRDSWAGYWHGAFHAPPVFTDRSILIRSRDALFCIRQ
jgi:hypothetical protein